MGTEKQMKLHDAMEIVLKERGGIATASELANEINIRKLYVRKDGQPLPSSQIKLRAKNYSQFRKTEDGSIELVDE